MEPFSLGTFAAIAAVNGLVQFISGNEARNASNHQLKRMEALFNKIKPPDYDLTIYDPPELHTRMLKMPEFSGAQAGPKWDLTELEPEDLSLIEKFVPKIAPLIAEAAPQTIEKTEDSKEGAEAEKKALRRFMEVGEGDFDPAYQQRVKEARDMAQAEAQSRNAAIQQDFERRGIGGSGLELASKIGSSAQSMNRLANMGMQAEAQAYQNQLNALAQGANLGAKIQDRETNIQSRNAAIINDFNQRMSKRQQDWEQARVSALNAADMRNINQAQRIADANIIQRNMAKNAERKRNDEIALNKYKHRMNEAARHNALQKWKYGAEGAEIQRANQAKLLKAQWLRDNTALKNKYKNQAYQDQLSKAAGLGGVYQKRANAEILGGRDRNSAIQGMGNMAMLYGMMGGFGSPQSGPSGLVNPSSNSGYDMNRFSNKAFQGYNLGPWPKGDFLRGLPPYLSMPK